ncbi:MAG TPA: DNA mismatch repair protein MutT [Candidatus Magasanikbacteria bacterium]|nr:DNA mismatch repair protein MutT [Candidatus Magasanikbacteria bacterium]
MKYTKQSEYVRPSAVGFILNQDKTEILLVQRNVEPYKDMWMMSGGHMKVGETIEECLVREVKEETGLDVATKELFTVHSDPEQDLRHAALVLFYVVEIKGGSIEQWKVFEIKDRKWFKLEDVPKQMCFHHRRIFDKFVKEYLHK